MVDNIKYEQPDKFFCRVLLSSTEEVMELEVWDCHLTPMHQERCACSVREWAKRHLEDWGYEDWMDRFDLERGYSYEIVFAGQIHGHLDNWTGEWDEEVDILHDEHQRLPDGYWDFPALLDVEVKDENGDTIPVS